MSSLRETHRRRAETILSCCRRASGAPPITQGPFSLPPPWGWLALSGPWSWTPCPWPLPSVAELCLFKEPDLILCSSCLRSGRSRGRRGGGGREGCRCRLQSRCSEVWGGSTRKSQVWRIQTLQGEFWPYNQKTHYTTYYFLTMNLKYWYCKFLVAECLQGQQKNKNNKLVINW